MAANANIKDHEAEARLFFHRVIVVLVALAIAIVIIIAKLYKLQILESGKYKDLAKENHLRVEPDPPTRGLIYDRNNKLLVDNLPTFNLEVIPEKVPCTGKKKRKECVRDEILSRIRTWVDIDESDFENFFAQMEKIGHRTFFSIPIRRNLNDDEIALVSARRHRWPGVDLVPRITRRYTFSNSLSHIIGYVSQPSEELTKSWDDDTKKAYAGTMHIGSTGIEKQYENLLHGRPGTEQVERNVHGRVINRTLVNPATPGKNIYLTIDIRLQALAEKLLGEKMGSVVALDPNNGEVLALVSKPGFDPNEFVTGVPLKRLAELNADPKRPLYARAVSGAYPPGSTIKPFYALGGLHYNVVNTDFSISCPGYFTLPGVSHRWRDWKKEGHGKVDLKVSIVRSCDVYYYGLAVKMAIDKITEILTRFGMGALTDIDLPNEKTGVLPSRAWKFKKFKTLAKKYPAANKWFTGDTVSVGIGQGYINITPIQLAYATSIIANRGKGFRPRLLYATEDAGTRERQLTSPVLKQHIKDIKAEHWDAVIDGMTNVVHQQWAGTAWRIAKFTEDKFKIAGKTGTAQVFTVEQEGKYKEEELPEHLKDHALFMSYAPVDNPKIVVAVLVEHGGHGSTAAAPIAGELIKAYLDMLKQDRESQEGAKVKTPEKDAEKSTPEAAVKKPVKADAVKDPAKPININKEKDKVKPKPKPVPKPVSPAEPVT